MDSAVKLAFTVVLIPCAKAAYWYINTDSIWPSIYASATLLLIGVTLYFLRKQLFKNKTTTVPAGIAIEKEIPVTLPQHFEEEVLS